jgi:hypothetical protein
VPITLRVRNGTGTTKQLTHDERQETSRKAEWRPISQMIWFGRRRVESGDDGDGLD